MSLLCSNSLTVSLTFHLVGGTPEEVPQTYHDRSPVNYADKITASLLILQGLNDKVSSFLTHSHVFMPTDHAILLLQVVPVDQAHEMVRKIESVGGKVEAIYYKGEGHG